MWEESTRENKCCDMQYMWWTGEKEEEGQRWSREIANLERSNGESGVGGWEQRGGRLVVFSIPAMWGRGSAIISDTTDNGNTSPYHYLFVLLGCLFLAETPSFLSLTLSTRLHSFSFTIHFSLSATDTFPSSPFFPPLFYFIVFFFSSLHPFWCLVPLSFLGFFVSPLHSLSMFKLYLLQYFSLSLFFFFLLLFPSFPFFFSLSVCASWQAMWGCVVQGQLSMAKLQ